jgi:hypothetical protein
MDRLNASDKYEGVQMVGLLMMHILSIIYFCYLINLAACICIYVITGTTELIFYYNRTNEFE